MMKKVRMRITAEAYKGIIILALIAPIALPACAETDKASRTSEAKNVAEAFCKAEFDGDEFNQRVKLIKYSPAREKKEKKRTGPASAWIIFWDWDPFYIVATYKVVDVEVSGDSAVATVDYQLLALSKGQEEIIPSRKVKDIVKLDLVYDGKQWWIFDPPLPRISKDRLIKIYEDKLRQFDNKWFASASNEQKKNFAKAQGALNILKSISN